MWDHNTQSDWELVLKVLEVVESGLLLRGRWTKRLKNEVAKNEESGSRCLTQVLPSISLALPFSPLPSVLGSVSFLFALSLPPAPSSTFPYTSALLIYWVYLCTSHWVPCVQPSEYILKSSLLWWRWHSGGKKHVTKNFILHWMMITVIEKILQER